MIRMNAAQQGGVAHRILPRAGRAIAACSLFGAMAFGVSDAYGGDARTSFDGDEGGRSVFAGALRQASPALFKMLDEWSSFLEEAAAASPSAEGCVRRLLCRRIIGVRFRTVLSLRSIRNTLFCTIPKDRPDAASVISWWDASGNGVAAHFIVNKDGSIVSAFLWMKLPTMRALGIRAITRRSAWRMKAETIRLARRLSRLGIRLRYELVFDAA
ncbi:MAG: hypothetical protein ACLT98_00985 [Eggerthellaceae bacterium]